MNFRLTQNTAFPLAEIALTQGEVIQIERGCMVYHNGHVSLEGKMNSSGEGLGGFMKAVGRSMVSGESFFITRAKGLSNNARIAIAPAAPGSIWELQIGAVQWRIQDSAFLACDDSVSYEMKRQSFGKAMLGGTGGFFIMETTGVGSMLINSYGDILEMKLDGGEPFTVDNTHVVAWSSTLNYEIKAASGTFGFATGEGLVNQFQGAGSVLIQTRNIKSLAGILSPFISKSS